MITFGASDRKFSHLDPRTKLILVLIVNVIMLAGAFDGKAGIIRLSFAFLPLLMLLSEKKIKTALIYLLLIIIALPVEFFVIHRTSGLANLLLVILAGIISRFIPGLMMGYYFVTTTTISEMVAALERMRLPRQFIIPFVVMVRFIPTVSEEHAAISDAMRMRGIRLGSGNLINILEYRMVPLMISTVKIGEELSASALTRGLGVSAKRTNICKIGFSPADFMLIFIAVVGFIGWSVL